MSLRYTDPRMPFRFTNQTPTKEIKPRISRNGETPSEYELALKEFVDFCDALKKETIEAEKGKYAPQETKHILNGGIENGR